MKMQSTFAVVHPQWMLLNGLMTGPVGSLEQARWEKVGNTSGKVLIRWKLLCVLSTVTAWAVLYSQYIGNEWHLTSFFCNKNYATQPSEEIFPKVSLHLKELCHLFFACAAECSWIGREECWFWGQETKSLLRKTLIPKTHSEQNQRR